jgi:hypothetical protein
LPHKTVTFTQHGVTESSHLFFVAVHRAEGSIALNTAVKGFLTKKMAFPLLNRRVSPTEEFCEYRGLGTSRKQDLRRGGIRPPDGSQVTLSAAILVLSLPLMKGSKTNICFKEVHSHEFRC